MDGQMLCCGPSRDRAQMRRQRIIDAARILFVNNGFHATGVAQIAKASGVAVGQIYRDFEAKEDIVAVIVEGDCGRFMARESLHRAIAAGDSEAVWAWIRQSVVPTDRVDTEPLFAEIIAESSRNPRIAAIFEQTHEEVRGNMLAALALLAPGEAWADRRALLTDLVLTHSFGLIQQRLLRPALDVERLADLIVAVIGREVETMRAEGATAHDGVVRRAAAGR